MSELWEDEGENLRDYDGDFPVYMVFHDLKDDKVKEMKVTEQAWNDTLKTFEDDNNVSDNVIFKYLSKQENVEAEPYFKED